MFIWCSAPELVFETTEYTTAIDSWSMGCVFAEMLTGKPKQWTFALISRFLCFFAGEALFPGETAVDQVCKPARLTYH